MDSETMRMMMDAAFGAEGAWAGMRPMASTIADLGNLFFFYEIKEFVNYRIDRFMEGFIGRTMSLAGAVALTLMTLWILFKGIRILAGKSQESMMALVMDSLRATLIVAAATTVAAGGSPVVTTMADGMTDVIYQTVTGEREDDPYSAIDKSLGYMQLAMLSIDALQINGDATVAAAKTRAQVFTGVGIAGPALVGGTLLMLNRIAIALFVGLGPIFILCLLFDVTKQLFSKWLLFGIGTMFSLGVLSVMVSLALDVVLAVAASFWVGNFLGTRTEGISSMALQQGGLGLVMTMLIVTVPPMAASFFQGTLGQFNPSNAFIPHGGFRGAAAGGRHHAESHRRVDHESHRYAPTSTVEDGRSFRDMAKPHPGAHNPATSPRLHSPASDEIKTDADKRRGKE